MANAPLMQTYQALEDVITQYPEGVAIDQIERSLPSAPNRRTLQRWLNALMAQHRIRREGHARAVKYWRIKPVDSAVQAMPPSTSSVTAHADTLIPLSPEAREVETQVRQPLMLRQPVGYQRDFLDSYRPNETAYLSQDIRDELLLQGQVLGGLEPAGTYARQLADRLLIDLSWNSSRLEGNTYSFLEAERLISAGEAATGKNALEAQMILNHKGAIEFLIDASNDIDFKRYTLLNLHALLSDNLLDDPSANGRLRSIPVGIGQTTFVPLEGPQRIEECFDQVLDTAAAIRDPFEQAFFVMVHLPYLQPFVDVNKRVSRLAANIPLIKRNLCPLSFVDVPQSLYISALLGVYECHRTELLRDVFVWAYKRSCARYSAVRQSLGDPDPFRLQHREKIFEVITHVVRQKMNKAQAARHIQQVAQQMEVCIAPVSLRSWKRSCSIFTKAIWPVTACGPVNSGSGLKHGSDHGHSAQPRPVPDKASAPTLPAHAPKASEVVDSDIHLLHDVHHTTTPIAVGEFINSIWDCKTLIEKQLIDYIRTTVVHAGGITHLRRIADLASLYPVRTGCHGATDLSPVCMGAALLDTWVPNFGVQEFFMPHSEEMLSVFPHDYRFERGMMHCGESPGHGVDIDEKLAAKYPYQRAYLPVNRLQHDGTLWNW